MNELQKKISQKVIGPVVVEVPILKKDLEQNLWVCPDCNKHHRIKPSQRFDILFGKNNYEIFKTPIPKDDPLNWTDSKSYKDRLKAARKKTGMECGMMVACRNY
jgi:acetyl-CoA carboxylase carboxyl transferase subunit beta